MSRLWISGNINIINYVSYSYPCCCQPHHPSWVSYSPHEAIRQNRGMAQFLGIPWWQSRRVRDDAMSSSPWGNRRDRDHRLSRKHTSWDDRDVPDDTRGQDRIFRSHRALWELSSYHRTWSCVRYGMVPDYRAPTSDDPTSYHRTPCYIRWDRIWWSDYINNRHISSTLTVFVVAVITLDHI